MGKASRWYDIQLLHILCGSSELWNLCARSPSQGPEPTHHIKVCASILDQKALTRPRRRQARPLAVSEVIYLEELLRDVGVDALDRYAAGVFLFALYGRCRWSDLKQVSHHFLDVNTTKGKTFGYVEFSTFLHKTAAQVARHGLPLPLVAPIWGLTNLVGQWSG